MTVGIEQRWYRYWASQPMFHVEPGTNAIHDGFHVKRSGRHFTRAAVLAVANQKGGVGKTTTCVSLSAALAQLGARVLMIDLDPQGNATSGLGMRAHGGQPTIYDVLVDGLEISDVVRETTVDGLDILPANIDLAGAEVELVSAFSREQRLKKSIDPIRDQYDVVLIDCPPSLGLLTVNALTAADGVVVPIQCEYYALEGLGALRRNAELIREHLNPALEFTGFVLTMLDARTRLSQQVVDEVQAHFGDRVFTTRIPRSVRLAEAPGFGQPITVFDPGSRGAMAYRRLAKELFDRLVASDAARERSSSPQGGSAPIHERSSSPQGGSAPIHERSSSPQGGSAPIHERSSSPQGGSAPIHERSSSPQGGSAPIQGATT